MTVKLLIIALLCASALADGVFVIAASPDYPQTVDFFTSLNQKYPDFVIIYYEGQAAFNQSFQNAAAAGYKSIHLALFESYADSFQREDTPANFTGRVWLTGNSMSYPHLVTLVENLANQGFQVGVLDVCLGPNMSGIVSSVVSSLPYAWINEEAYGDWVPFAGWSCPSINVTEAGYDDKTKSAIFSCHVNVDCV